MSDFVKSNSNLQLVLDFEQLFLLSFLSESNDTISAVFMPTASAKTCLFLRTMSL